jgi:hypothetical protein
MRATLTLAWPEFTRACVFFDALRWLSGGLND